MNKYRQPGFIEVRLWEVWAFALGGFLGGLLVGWLL